MALPRGAMGLSAFAIVVFPDHNKADTSRTARRLKVCLKQERMTKKEKKTKKE